MYFKVFCLILLTSFTLQSEGYKFLDTNADSNDVKAAVPNDMTGQVIQYTNCLNNPAIINISTTFAPSLLTPNTDLIFNSEFIANWSVYVATLKITLYFNNTALFSKTVSVEQQLNMGDSAKASYAGKLPIMLAKGHYSFVANLVDKNGNHLSCFRGEVDN